MRTKFPLKSSALISGWGALALGFAALVSPARDEEAIGPEMTDFRAQLENYEPPNEAQIKTLLEGARAQPRSGQIWITEARLTTFRTNGALEMRAVAPHCIFDSAEKTVSSPGPVQIQTADQRFFLEGEGFLLRQTNSNLIISNRVHTIIRNAPGKPPKS